LNAIACVGADWGYYSAQLAGVPVVPSAKGFTGRYVFWLNWSHPICGIDLEEREHVNFHCSALPEGRGGHPIENLILLGRTETVVTAHRMTTVIDGGPVYGMRGPISLAGTKEEITARFIWPVADLMKWILATNPEPYAQMGVPTIFRRMSPDAYRDFWAKREGWQTS
jgi:methionyl-tRNA formyltransferase